MLTKKIKKSWRHKEWFEFSDKVKKRDNYECLKCGRSESQVILQVHHNIYREDKEPWEYALSDCLTLCKGCHAREHNLIEPNSGWHLFAIDDLGGLDGTCERTNCETSIRYEHLTYHPNWGYKIVGSTCIMHLTQKDKKLSGKILKIYRAVSTFISTSVWNGDVTKNRKKFIETIYKHHKIRIYGTDKKYAFQIALKEKGARYYHFKDVVSTRNKGLEEVKELTYIALHGLLSEDEQDIKILRGIYQSIL